MKKTHIPMEMNPTQVRNILKFIDASQSEVVKEEIFTQLGQECFYVRKINAWVEQYQGDVQAFLDWVNLQHASKYWESLEFDKDHNMLILTGRKVEGCACAFADCQQPPKSLCHYCCKSMQQALFGMLLGQQVEVAITEAYLLGGERCSSKIQLIG